MSFTIDRLRKDDPGEWFLDARGESELHAELTRRAGEGELAAAFSALGALYSFLSARRGSRACSSMLEVARSVAQESGRARASSGEQVRKSFARFMGAGVAPSHAGCASTQSKKTNSPVPTRSRGRAFTV